MEFGVFGDLGLQDDCGFGGIEAGGQEVDGDLQGVFGDGGGVGVVGGEGVPVGDEVETFVRGIGLELDPVLQGADVVAEMQLAGRAHAAEDALASWILRRGQDGFDGITLGGIGGKLCWAREWDWI